MSFRFYWPKPFFILLPSPFGEGLGVRLSFKILFATHNINAFLQWL